MLSAQACLTPGIWIWASFADHQARWYKGRFLVNHCLRSPRIHSQAKSTKPEVGKVKLYKQAWCNTCNTIENFKISFTFDCGNRMTGYLWCSYLQVHNLPFKISSTVYSSPYNVLTTTFKYIISVSFYFVSQCVHMRENGQNHFVAVELPVLCACV